MEKPTIKFEEQFLLHETQTDQYVNEEYNEPFLTNRRNIYLSDYAAAKTLKNIIQQNPKWQVEVIKHTIQTIEFDEVVQLEVD